MYKTYGERYNSIQKQWEEVKDDDFGAVIRSLGILGEGILINIINHFRYTLNDSQDSLSYFNFFRDNHEETSNFFSEGNQSWGKAIGLYKKLLEYFPQHPWMDRELLTYFNDLKDLRNPNSHPGYANCSDDAARKAKRNVNLIFKKTGFDKIEEDYIGFPLSEYLVFVSAAETLEHVRNAKDIDKDKAYGFVTSDCKKILPKFLISLLWKIFPYEKNNEQEKIIKAIEYCRSSSNINEVFQIFIELFKNNKTLDKIKDTADSTLIERMESWEKEITTTPFNQAHEIVTVVKMVVDYLKNKQDENIDNKLAFAVTIKRMYMHDKTLSDDELNALENIAKTNKIDESISVRIRENVITSIQEITLFDTVFEDFLSQVSSERKIVFMQVEQMIELSVEKKKIEEYLISKGFALNDLDSELKDMLSQYDETACEKREIYIRPSSQILMTFDEQEDLETEKLLSTSEKAIEFIMGHALEPEWDLELNKELGVDKTRVTKILIGSLDPKKEDCIFVGTTTNMILLYDLDGHKYPEEISLEAHQSVEDMFFFSLDHNSKMLVVVTNDNIIRFYGPDNRGKFCNVAQMKYTKGTITVITSSRTDVENPGFYFGDDNGNVNYVSQEEYSLKSFQLICNRFPGDKVVGIGDYSTDGGNRLYAIYENGMIVLLDKDNSSTEFDQYNCGRNILHIKKYNDYSFLVATVDDYVYKVSCQDDKVLILDYVKMTEDITSIIAHEDNYYLISEDSEILISYNLKGDLRFITETPYEISAGYLYNDHLIVGSRNGIMAKMKIMNQAKLDELWEVIIDSYNKKILHANRYQFIKYFNREISSARHKFFFMEYLKNLKENKKFVDNFNYLYRNKNYNTRLSSGMFSVLTAHSDFIKKVKDIMKHESLFLKEIDAYFDKVQAHTDRVLFLQKAENAINTDIHEYIALMEEVKIKHLDKLWQIDRLWNGDGTLEDDIVGFDIYPDFETGEDQLLICTKKGKLFLINKDSGEIIWKMKIELGDSKVACIKVENLCLDKEKDIILGYDNSDNFISVIVPECSGDMKNEKGLVSYERDEKKTFEVSIVHFRAPWERKNTVLTLDTIDFDDDNNIDIVVSTEGPRLDTVYLDDDSKEINFDISKKVNTAAFGIDKDIVVINLSKNTKGNIVLYTGNSVGTINKFIYAEGVFSESLSHHVERDAQITDLKTISVDGNILVVYSSDDNYIYCLSENLEYLWSYKTLGDVKGLDFIKGGKETLLIAISEDGFLHVLHLDGRKKWTYPLYNPLEKILVYNDEIFISNYDGDIMKLNIIDKKHVDQKMKKALSSRKISYESMLDSPNKYLRIYAAQRLLEAKNIDFRRVIDIMNMMNDRFEYEDLVRIEIFQLITEFIITNELINDEDILDFYLTPLDDINPQVRYEVLKTVFRHYPLFSIKNKKEIMYFLYNLAAKESDVWNQKLLIDISKHLLENGDIPPQHGWIIIRNLTRKNKNNLWIMKELVLLIIKFIEKLKTPEQRFEAIVKVFSLGLRHDEYKRLSTLVEDKKTAHLINDLYQFLISDKEISDVEEELKTIVDAFAENLSTSYRFIPA